MIEIATAKDIAGLTLLLQKIEKQNAILLRHLSANQTIDIKEIAQQEGVSVRTLTTSGRYLLPRFGESAYPTGKARWPISEYVEWSLSDPEARKQRLQAMLADQLKRDAKRIKAERH